MAAAAAKTTKAAEELTVLDEERLALLGGGGATAAPACVGAEWEAFKENVRPLKRGRDVSLLNRALKAHADPSQRAALLATRRYDATSPSRLVQKGFPVLGRIWSGASCPLP